MRHDNIIKIAIKVASLSEHHNFRIGAVIAKKNKIISMGINKKKTHPRQVNHYTNIVGSSIHAELDAIIRAPHNLLENSTIYVARLLRNNKIGLTKPCKSCIAIFKEYKIKTMVYTTYDSWEIENV